MKPQRKWFGRSWKTIPVALQHPDGEVIHTKMRLYWGGQKSVYGSRGKWWAVTEDEQGKIVGSSKTPWIWWKL